MPESSLPTNVLNIPFQDLTPGMKQYQDIKREHPDCLVMLRMGDFYEMFYQDAITASRELEITLTARGQGEKRAPLAGVPFHAIEGYLGKLVKKGYKVAIVEQLEDPKKAKGLVKRGLVRIVTPGTVMEPALLEEKSNNYLAAVTAREGIIWLAACDISTGEFFTKQVPEIAGMAELVRLQPKECLFPESFLVNQEISSKMKAVGCFVQAYPDHFFSQEKSREVILSHFSPAQVASFGIEGGYLPVCGALLSYLQETQRNSLSHLQRIIPATDQEYLLLDANTLRHLEVLRNTHDGSTRATLWEVLDHTSTAMGGRLLKKWLQHPLAKKEAIEHRQEAIAELKEQFILQQEIREILRGMADVERIIGRVNAGTANPRELVTLRTTLRCFPLLQKKLQSLQSSYWRELAAIHLAEELAEELQRALRDDPPITIREGGIFREGYSSDLDEFLSLSHHSKLHLQEIEERERQKTGISNLRLGYTSVFGYFIEITKKNQHLVPDSYIRKQTTATSERYVTEELKLEEEKILHAQERSEEMEYQLFQQLCQRVTQETAFLQETAKKIAAGDVLLSLAEVASTFAYCRPTLTEEKKLMIKQGRHPVVEKYQQNFISNDLELQPGEMMIITGPNMSGKSTIMRQTALIVLLAHLGSFVPAQEARIGLTDRIFSRVGASDDLSAGQSTFMVEMQETAVILQQATSSSFIILDEIGRGTSTFDGVSIAWSVAEYLAQTIRCRALFATHYHVLNKLAEQNSSIKNFNVAVHEKNGEVTLLHKLVPGGTDQSYGIHVAKLAGIPATVIARAQEIQGILERDDSMARKLKAQRLGEQVRLDEFGR